jgi:predicted MPP superfamily phosphohydrolase
MALRVVIFIILWLLAEFYSFLVVRSAVRKFSPAVRLTVIILHIVLSIGTIVGMIFFRHIHWTIFPSILRNLFIATAMGMFIGKLLVLVVMLIDDVWRGGVWAYNKLVPKREEIEDPKSTLIPRSTFIMRLGLGVAALSFGGFIYGMRNRYRYHVRNIRLTSPNVPAAFKGLRIVQISDIHTGSFDDPKAVEAGIQKILDLKPDVIFFTGDLVNERTDEVTDTYKQIYSKLKAPLGVYSTLGNHDYGDYEQWDTEAEKEKNLQDIIQLHADMGWKLMMDEHAILEKGGDRIGLLGVQNISAIARFHSYGNMEKAYRGIAEQNVPFKILLSHDPTHWDKEILDRYKDIDLTLSGHTHGMQFGVEIPGFKWSPSQYIFDRWAGLYSQQEQHLYVNRGFGFLGYPGRVGILAEISVIELA